MPPSGTAFKRGLGALPVSKSRQHGTSRPPGRPPSHAGSRERWQGRGRWAPRTLLAGTRLGAAATENGAEMPQKMKTRTTSGPGNPTGGQRTKSKEVSAHPPPQRPHPQRPRHGSDRVSTSTSADKQTRETHHGIAPSRKGGESLCWVKSARHRKTGPCGSAHGSYLTQPELQKWSGMGVTRATREGRKVPRYLMDMKIVLQEKKRILKTFHRNENTLSATELYT